MVAADLAPQDVVPYLLAAGLLSSRDVVDGDLVLRDMSRRNANVQVLDATGTGFFLKRAVGAERRATLRHEAAVYESFWRDPAAEPLRRHLPRLCHDDDLGVLVLEMRGGARNLREHYARRGRFSRAVAAALGDALAALHRLDGGWAAGLARPPGMDGVPWVLSFSSCDAQAFSEYSDGCIALLRIIQQQPGFAARLEGARAGWSPQCLVHNDVRWDNWVLAPRPDGGGKPDVWLVDWELAGVGDPAWDVGSVFAGYLTLWLLSLPATPDTPPEELPRHARWPLDRMHPAIGAFWSRYVRRRELDAASAAETLLRSVVLAAARVLQTAVEGTQDHPEPTADAVLALQLTENMLARPQDAARSLLGIEPPGMRRAAWSGHA